MTFDRSTWRGRLRWFTAEFLVVLAGILAAFTIDAWWAHRHDAQEERAALRELDSVLIDHFDGGKPVDDSAGKSFGDLVIYRKHIANSAPFESIKSRGLSLVSDDSLRLALVDFYGSQTAGVALVNDTNTEIVQKLVWPYYIENIKVPGGENRLAAAGPINYPTLSRDSRFRLWLEHQLAAVRGAVPVYQRALNNAEALRRRVKADLGGN